MNRRQFLGGAGLVLAGGIRLTIASSSNRALSTAFGDIGGVHTAVTGYRRPLPEERVFVPDVTSYRSSSTRRVATNN